MSVGSPLKPSGVATLAMASRLAARCGPGCSARRDVELFGKLGNAVQLIVHGFSY